MGVTMKAIRNTSHQIGARLWATALYWLLKLKHVKFRRGHGDRDRRQMDSVILIEDVVDEIMDKVEDFAAAVEKRGACLRHPVVSRSEAHRSLVKANELHDEIRNKLRTALVEARTGGII